MNMKYLKPASAILVGSSVSGFNKATTEECTATLGLTTLCSDGSGEQLQGIYVTRSQLEQMRNEIDNYLRNTAEGEPKLGVADSLRKPEATAVTSDFNVNITGNSNFSKEEEIGKLLLEIAQRVTETQGRQSNDAESKQKLKINPELVWIEQSAEIPSKPYSAKIYQWCNPGDGNRGSISLYALGKSEEEARATLDAQFEALVLRCADTGLTKPEVSDVTFNEQLNEFKQKIQKDMSDPKIRALMKTVTGQNWSEAPSATPNLDNSEEANDTPTPKSKKTEPQKAEEKSQIFKLNPDKVASRKVSTSCINPWEARVTLSFDLDRRGQNCVDMIGRGDCAEEARSNLDAKFTTFVRSMI